MANANTNERAAWIESCPACGRKGGHMEHGRWQACEHDGCEGTGMLVSLAPRGAGELTALSVRLRGIVADDHTTVAPALGDEQQADVVVAAATIDDLRAQVARLERELALHKAVLKAEHAMRMGRASAADGAAVVQLKVAS